MAIALHHYMINLNLTSRVLGGLLILVAFGVARADEPTTTSVGKIVTVKMIKVPGQPYIWQFSDGREAAIKETFVDMANVHAQIKVTDNNCSNRLGMSCDLIFNVRRVWVSLVWTKNPDPKKIGKIVRQGGNDCESSGIVTGFDRKGLKTLNAALPQQILRCDDYSWLPNANVKTLNINHWESELGENNPETGLLENRASGGVYGVTFSRLNRKDFQLDSIRAYNGQLKFLDFLFASVTSSLTLQNENGMVCQTEMSSNFINEFIMLYDQLGAQKPDVANAPTYIYGSDEVIGWNQIDQDVKYWYQPNVLMEYQ